MTRTTALLNKELRYNILLLKKLKDKITEAEYATQKKVIDEEPLPVAKKQSKKTRQRSTRVEAYQMPLNTLQGALDNFLNFPKLIVRRDGKVMVRTSKKKIERGEVQLNGFIETDPGAKIRKWDLIHWAYKERCFTWQG